MTATEADRPRLLLEDALGALCDVEERLRCVGLRITQRMRTEAELQDVTEINQSRRAIQRCKATLVQLHPNRR